MFNGQDDENINQDPEIVNTDEENSQPQESETEVLHNKIAVLELAAKRAMADYQNLQRRVAEDRQSMIKFATEEILMQLLPVVTHLETAVLTAPSEDKKSGWFAAVTISVGQLKDVLKKEGLEEINPEDKQFDGNEHEAVDVIEGKDNRIIKVYEKGYKLHGKVVKAARVQVGKKG